MMLFQVNENERVELRALVDEIEHKISELPRHATAEVYWTAADELLSSWAGLQELLEQTGAPALLGCPVCKHGGRLGATRCGYCWKKLALGATRKPCS